MSDASIPGGQAPTPSAPVEEQNLDAAKPVEAADSTPTQSAAPVEPADAPAEQSAPAPAAEVNVNVEAPADQVSDDTPGVDDSEETTS